jgi:protein gp37
MSKETGIAWCNHTFNPWWGCQRISPGCENCYAETFSRRVGLQVWGPTTDRRTFGDKHWDEPIKWCRDAVDACARRRVFCASMADVFESRQELEVHRARLWSMIEKTSTGLDWLLLTKRPENIAGMLPWLQTPRRNVWLGVTAEDQKHADKRIPLLMQTPAAVRFVSYEPALGPIDFSNWPTLDWIIVGGESGSRARDFQTDWARATIAYGRKSGTKVFVKQLGRRPITDGINIHYGSYRDRFKSDNPDMWPKDLQVQEFPSS